MCLLWALQPGMIAMLCVRLRCVSKETYYSVKRDLLQCQKRPTTVSKETFYSVKRDLLQCQKRPTSVSKETYTYLGAAVGVAAQGLALDFLGEHA